MITGLPSLMSTRARNNPTAPEYTPSHGSMAGFSDLEDTPDTSRSTLRWSNTQRFRRTIRLHGGTESTKANYATIAAWPPVCLGKRISVQHSLNFFMTRTNYLKTARRMLIAEFYPQLNERQTALFSIGSVRLIRLEVHSNRDMQINVALSKHLLPNSACRTL